MQTEKIKASEIMEKLMEARQEISSHYSDLYTPVNEVTREIVDNYESKQNVTTFKSQIDGRLWFDIPFAYLDFKRREKTTRNLYSLTLFLDVEGRIVHEPLSISKLDRSALLEWLDQYLKENPALESMMTGYKINIERVQT